MAKDLYQNITDRIIGHLEAGTAPWIRPYSRTPGANVPMNAITNRPYSGINVLLFWTAATNGWPTPRFLTYKQAKEHGGQVRKGEHGMPLYFWKQLVVPDKVNPDKLVKVPLIKEYTVFNVAQVDGLPDRIANGPVAKVLNTDERHTAAEAFILDTGAKIVHDITPSNAPMYIPSMDYISLPPFISFRSSPRYYGTAFHELGHWTGHKTRLDRDLKGRFGNAEYAAEELIAELTAAFVSAEFGIDNEQQNASYIASWIKLLKDDPRAIVTAASKAQAAANYLHNAADDKLELAA